MANLCSSDLSLTSLRTDLAYLRTDPDLTLEEAAIYSSRKPALKAALKRGPHHDEYLEYRTAIRDLRQKYLPFRAIDYIRQGIKRNEPGWFYPKLWVAAVFEGVDPQGIDPAQHKDFLSRIEGLFVKATKQAPEAAALAGRITCLHGTNSSLFSLLPFTDHTMLPTGRLLERGIAPMSGEIFREGMGENGVNQTSLSFCVIEDIARCWKYAEQTSYSFFPPREFATTFKRVLDEWKERTAKNGYDSRNLISMLRLKQWDPSAFKTLCEENAQEIEQICKDVLEKSCCKERKILKALECPTEEVVKGVTDLSVRERINQEFFPTVIDFVGNEWFEVRESGRSLSFFFQDINDILQQQVFTESDVNRILCAIFFAKVNPLSAQLKFLQKRLEEPKNCWQEALQWLQECKKEGWIEHPEGILQKKLREPIETRIRKNMRSFQKNYQQLLALFSLERPLVQLGPVDRQNITHSYPILLASTKLNPILNDTEYSVSEARIGRDIDLFFVPPEHIGDAEGWLKSQRLDGHVRVLPTTLIEPMKKLPLIHAASQVIDYKSRLREAEEQRSLNQKLNARVFPLCHKPSSDGAFKPDVAHVARAACFSLALMKLYAAKGKEIASKPSDLQLAAALHACARKDLKQSKETYAKILRKQGASVVNCIADASPDCLEQKIINNAVRIDLFSCNPDEFQSSELDSEILSSFIAEAQKFILLTEKPVIRQFLEKTAEPYRALFQMIQLAEGQFPILRSLLRSGIAGLASPSDYLLTTQLEAEISEEKNKKLP